MHGVFAASSSPSTVLVVSPSLVPSAISSLASSAVLVAPSLLAPSAVLVTPSSLVLLAALVERPFYPFSSSLIGFLKQTPIPIVRGILDYFSFFQQQIFHIPLIQPEL
jgi:hypothetical protein